MKKINNRNLIKLKFILKRKSKLKKEKINT